MKLVLIVLTIELILRIEGLVCPAGTEQIGALNADIGGCGLEGCNARYQDNYADINACKAGCDNNDKCESFTWAPLNGDRNHQGKSVCTLYNSKVPTGSWSPQQIMCAPLECPAGTEQIGAINADIGGCGLEGCNARYQDNYGDIVDCKEGCDDNAQCMSFTWAPMDGDRNHPGKTVCTLYNSIVPNQVWSPNQIMCAGLVCPVGTEQIGVLNSDIGGCGLEGCNARYQDRYADINACAAGCNSNAQCESFTWAPLNGDRNHQGKSVCTLYNGKVPNQLWSPLQIMCNPLRCPAGTTQIGGLNADIGGCGLEGCNARYQDNYKSIDECKAGCDNNAQCVSFTWAPLDGDRNHPGKTVCTLYNSKVSNQQWSPNQIMCATESAAAEISNDLYIDNDNEYRPNSFEYPSIPQQPSPSSPSSLWVINLSSPYMIGMGMFLVLLLCVNIMFMYHINCGKPQNGRISYSSVKYQDSEYFDDSEAANLQK